MCVPMCVCVRETEREEACSTYYVYTAKYIHTVQYVHVCICVYFGPPVGLKRLWVRPGPGLIMVPHMRWFCGRLRGDGVVVTPVNSVTVKLEPAPWHGAVGMSAWAKMTPSFLPFRPEGEISHIWFIYSFVQKWGNIKKEIQICFKEWENSSFPAG